MNPTRDNNESMYRGRIREETCDHHDLSTRLLRANRAPYELSWRVKATITNKGGGGVVPLSQLDYY